ncbi:MAG: tyrosine-type recombinase/integrase [Elusimicrobia bacterium]|nr:tyrosine-type recombinase/integrase [Elusimicrobiota bacterium]
MQEVRLTALKPESLTWDQALRLFALRSRSQNFAASTQVLYTCHLGLWRRWLQSQGDPAPYEVTPAILRAYLDSLRARGRRDAYADGAFRILKVFWHFLEREGLILVNPMARVERPRREKRLIKAFSAEQVRLLLAAIDTRDPLGLRDHALTVLLADTGLRLSEALGLRVQDVDFGQSLLTVFGKGRKERLVPFGQAVRRELMDWLKTRGDLPGMDLLWCNRFGRQLSRRTVEDRLKDHGARAKLQGVRCSPHTLRHFFAVQYLRNGGDVFTLQKILGHATLDMVRLYAQMADTDVQARHRLASPMDCMGQLPGERRQVRLR